MRIVKVLRLSKYFRREISAPSKELAADSGEIKYRNVKGLPWHRRLTKKNNLWPWRWCTSSFPIPSPCIPPPCKPLPFLQKCVSVKQRVRDNVSGHISLSAYEQVATSRFMCKDHQKQPDVTRKGHPPLSSVPHGCTAHTWHGRSRFTRRHRERPGDPFAHDVDRCPLGRTTAGYGTTTDKEHWQAERRLAGAAGLGRRVPW